MEQWKNQRPELGYRFTTFNASKNHHQHQSTTDIKLGKKRAGETNILRNVILKIYELPKHCTPDYNLAN